jgi:Ca-activated chloride channel family protein
VSGIYAASLQKESPLPFHPPSARARATRSGLRSLLPFALALSLLAAGSAPAAPRNERRRQLTDEEVERLRGLHLTEQEEVRLVQVPAVVTNRQGRVVRGLGKDAFVLSEDYVPQTIRYISTEADRPLSIAFLLDVSGSMRQLGRLDEAKEAIRTFVAQLGPADRVGLVCFADEQVAWVTDFTVDRAEFLRRLEVQRGYGQTALYDALAAAPRLVDEREHGRAGLVLFTDGVDTASTMGTFDALQLARSVNVPIYAVGFADFAARLLPRGSVPPRHRTVGMFAEETGGQLFVVQDPDDLKDAVLAIGNELRFRYVISYRPTRRVWDGTFRRIHLDTVDGALNVRARTGYYAVP